MRKDIPITKNCEDSVSVNESSRVDMMNVTDVCCVRRKEERKKKTRREK